MINSGNCHYFCIFLTRMFCPSFMAPTTSNKQTSGQCLEGGTFKRCGVDTLWYVTGTNTQYQLHHRPLEEGEDVSCRYSTTAALTTPRVLCARTYCSYNSSFFYLCV